MPVRKTIFANNYHYHIFNRGVEKRVIFQDEKDYNAFLEILAYYLIPDKKKPDIFSRKSQVKIAQAVSLLSYCLMPNHFHFLIKQKKDNGIVNLMHALGTTYSMYFNKRHDRVGSLFQGRFKAKIVTKDNYLLQLSKYIHLNPQEVYKKPLVSYPYSSYKFYLQPQITPKDFIDVNFILDYFSSENKHLSYKTFVEDLKTDFSPIESLLFL